MEHFFNAGNGASNHPCSNLYRGHEAASEPETKAIQQYLNLRSPGTIISTRNFQ